jgi:hypothetical protein
VVRVALEARLLPAQGLEFALGRACLAALQIASAVGEGAPLLFDARAGVDGGVRVGSDVDDAQVDAQKVVHVSRRNIGRLERGVQVERAIAQDEVGLTAQTVAACWYRPKRHATRCRPSSASRLTCSGPFHDMMRSS